MKRHRPGRRGARLRRSSRGGRLVLVVALLAGVAFIASNANQTPDGRPSVETFRLPSGGGYGYQVSTERGLTIHQPHLPGVPGTVGFASPEEARKVADLVASRLRDGTCPPAVSPEDLDSLGVGAAGTGEDVRSETRRRRE